MIRFVILVFVLSLAGCASNEQSLLDQHQGYNDTKTRVLKYATLDRCATAALPEPHPTCADQATVDGLKDDIRKADATFNDAWADPSKDKIAVAGMGAGVVKKDLSDHNINCGPAATDSCP